MTRLLLRGFDIRKAYLDAGRANAADRSIAPDSESRAAVPAGTTPSGKQMSVRMTSAGALGWVTDKAGISVSGPAPSESRRPWPDIPEPVLMHIWRDLVRARTDAPDCCLINYYGEGAKMGLHQDKDEADFSWPVLSVSLGDDALFRIGNTTRGGKTESIWLNSGDVVIMGGSGAADLSRGRPDPVRVLETAAQRRADQPDAARGA